MQELPDLSGLSSEAKDALIRLLWEQCQELSQRVEALEKRPQKTSKNSSRPRQKGLSRIRKRSPKAASTEPRVLAEQAAVVSCILRHIKP